MEVLPKLQGSGESSLPVSVMDNDNGTYTVQYEAAEAGEYVVNVSYEGSHILASPFFPTIKAIPSASLCSVASKWSAAGKTSDEMERDKSFTCGDTLVLQVDTGKAGCGELTATSCDADGQETQAIVLPGADETSAVYIPNVQKAGCYVIDVLWAGERITDSPFTIKVEDPFTTDHVKVSRIMLSCNFYIARPTDQRRGLGKTFNVPKALLHANILSSLL